MRAIRARYDPYEQTRGRVDQLRGLGHSVDKVEIMCVLSFFRITSLIQSSIMGGTFMSMPEDYRNKFVAGLHNALSGHNGDDIDEAVTFGEQGKTKCVGITIETRPDYCLKPHLR